MKKIMSILMLMFMMGSISANGGNELGQADGCPRGDDCMKCAEGGGRFQVDVSEGDHVPAGAEGVDTSTTGQ